KDLVLAVWRAFDRRAVSAGLNLKSVGFIFLLYHVSLFFIEYYVKKMLKFLSWREQEKFLSGLGKWG
ncbi:hypothetical protein, partial [Streptococcus acidominimus]